MHTYLPLHSNPPWACLPEHCGPRAPLGPAHRRVNEAAEAGKPSARPDLGLKKPSSSQAQPVQEDHVGVEYESTPRRKGVRRGD